MNASSSQPDFQRQQRPPYATLLRLVDAGFLGIIFLAPLFMGGRHPVGQIVFVSLTVFIAITWLLRQCFLNDAKWRFSVEWLLLAGIGLVSFQLVPLPQPLLSKLAPDTARLLPLWTSADGSALGSWMQISLSPVATRGALTMFIAYGLLFVIVVQRIEKPGDAKRLVQWLALGAVWMATLGIVQYLASNGLFLWVYEHPFRTPRGVQGPFINRNHFAHLLALGIAPLVYWLLSSWRETSVGRQRRFQTTGGNTSSNQLVPIALAIACVIVTFAALMSLSRGGVLAMGIAMVVGGCFYFASSLLTKKHFYGLVGLAILLGASLFIHGMDRVTNRLNDLTALSVDELDRHSARQEVWQANYQAMIGSPWLGRGVGAHREFNKSFMQHDRPVEYTHAESGPIQIASESGLVGLAMLCSGVGLCIFWCISGARRTGSKQVLALIGTASAGLAASLAHSMVDFVWYIPACMSWTVLLAAIAFRLYQFSAQPSANRFRLLSLAKPSWALALLLLTAVGCWLLSERLPSARASASWDRYLRTTQRISKPQQQPNKQTESAQEPTDSDGYKVHVKTLFAELDQCLKHDPSNCRAHLRMSANYLSRFHLLQTNASNAMKLSDFRGAAFAEKFASRDALDQWLQRAVGDHRILLDKALWHARRGLQLCPLQGEGYLYLAELCFLEGATDAAKNNYIQQALRVRPFDGHVLFVAGKEALLDLDPERTVRYWKHSFHSGSQDKQRLISMLAGYVPVESLLQSFQPSVSDWSIFYDLYKDSKHADEMHRLSDYFFELAKAETTLVQKDAANDQMWLTMHKFYRQTDDRQRSEFSITSALHCAPEKYTNRINAATYYLDIGEFKIAEGHLRWCLERRPNQRVRQLLDTAIRKRFARDNHVSKQQASLDTSSRF